MLSSSLLLAASSLVAAAPYHVLKHRHLSEENNHESLSQRNLPLDMGTLPRMSNESLKETSEKCPVGPAQLPLNLGVPNPVVPQSFQQQHLFASPTQADSVPNNLTIRNHCGYDLYLTHMGSWEQGLVLPAGGTHSTALVGTNMKVSKDASGTQPNQIEYHVSGGGVMYNLSLIDCLGKMDGKINTDVSGCAGHEEGLQLGQDGGASFQCKAGAWCDDQAYFYGENLCADENPILTGDVARGLVAKFCAARGSSNPS